MIRIEHGKMTFILWLLFTISILTAVAIGTTLDHRYFIFPGMVLIYLSLIFGLLAIVNSVILLYQRAEEGNYPEKYYLNKFGDEYRYATRINYINAFQIFILLISIIWIIYFWRYVDDSNISYSEMIYNMLVALIIPIAASIITIIIQTTNSHLHGAVWDFRNRVNDPDKGNIVLCQKKKPQLKFEFVEE